MEEFMWKDKAIELTTYWIDLANDMYKLNLPYPYVSFKLKGRTAGKAFLMANEVRYNPILLEENKDSFLNRTVPHEVAHLVAYTKDPVNGRGHGYLWKRIMRDFGLDASRCHSYDTTNTRQSKSTLSRNYPYKCACKTHNLTSIRHHRILKGAQYSCKHCNQILKAI